MLVALLVALNALLLAAAIPMAVNLIRIKRSKERAGRGSGRWPIPRVPVEQLDAIFAPNEFGPTLATEVALVCRGTMHVQGGTSDFEAWILAVLAKRSALMFEFGTCTGKTAYLWARNLPPGGRVVTLTLGPEQLSQYREGAGDSALATQWAREESTFTRFLYTGTDVEERITQLFGDSKAFDETPYVGRCDVVFVDGSHAHSYVVSDTAKALRMVRPGGIVLWHDYSGPSGAVDVFRALNELARTLPLVHIAGTTLVAYRQPAG